MSQPHSFYDQIDSSFYDQIDVHELHVLPLFICWRTSRLALSPVCCAHTVHSAVVDMAVQVSLCYSICTTYKYLTQLFEKLCFLTWPCWQVLGVQTSAYLWKWDAIQSACRPPSPGGFHLPLVLVTFGLLYSPGGFPRLLSKSHISNPHHGPNMRWNQLAASSRDRFWGGTTFTPPVGFLDSLVWGHPRGALPWDFLLFTWFKPNLGFEHTWRLFLLPAYPEMCPMGIWAVFSAQGTIHLHFSIANVKVVSRGV